MGEADCWLTIEQFFVLENIRLGFQIMQVVDILYNTSQCSPLGS